MKQILASFLAGLLFGTGLALSSMIDPNKVLNFLDVAGNWDPSLAFVMIGALSVSFIAYHFVPKRRKPIFENKFRLPTRTDIDTSLVLGATLFGIGWGMAGFCPGPALSIMGMGLLDPTIFVISMIAGFIVQRYIYEKR